MKKIMLTFLVITVFLLSGCFSNKEPIYIDNIVISLDDEQLTGTLKYFDGTNWFDYDPSTKNQTNVYYSFDVILGDSITVIIDTYSPDKEISEMSLTLSKDLNSLTNIGAWAVINGRNGDNVQSSYSIDEVSASLNVITIYGWLTSDGPKYVGAKTVGTNYVIKGVHFNYI